VSPAAHRYRLDAMKLGGNDGVISANSFAICLVGCAIAESKKPPLRHSMGNFKLLRSCIGPNEQVNSKCDKTASQVESVGERSQSL
jgi:hypothetical protein